MRIVRIPSVAAVTLVAVLAFAAQDAGAQTGSVSGFVRDSAGKPIAYANIVVVGTHAGAMSDTTGHYVIPRVIAGRYRVRAMHGGCYPNESGVVVQPGSITHADFALEPAPPRPVEKAKPGVVTREQLEPVVGYALPTTTSNDLEFGAGYFVETSGESTLVHVVAHATNSSEHAIDLCGGFSFIELPYQLERETWAREMRFGTSQRSPDIPRLEGVGRERRSPAMDCDPMVLAPGMTVADTLRFSYDPGRFAKWPGEVSLRCIFFRGTRSDPWENTVHVDLGTLIVPIR